ncbi:MAG: histidine phosphatase family protein [Lachnospiraceae bacterium]|nr:histidine phosphatase family protein [Lachnospiraceae bacterium]
MEIYIVRHGETRWNSKKRLQGSIDIPLNENGRAVAIDAGNRLDNVTFDAIYSSPLIRAYETACLIRGRKNIPIIRDDRLREMNFGVNEGQCKTEMEKDGTNPFNYFFNAPEKYFPPENGESFEELCQRTKDFMKEVIEPLEGEMNRVMIVGHGAMNKAIMCYIQNHGIEDFWKDGLQKNCESTIFKYVNGRYFKC